MKLRIMHLGLPVLVTNAVISKKSSAPCWSSSLCPAPSSCSGSSAGAFATVSSLTSQPLISFCSRISTPLRVIFQPELEIFFSRSPRSFLFAISLFNSSATTSPRDLAATALQKDARGVARRARGKVRRQLRATLRANGLTFAII